MNERIRNLKEQIVLLKNKANDCRIEVRRFTSATMQYELKADVLQKELDTCIAISKNEKT